MSDAQLIRAIELEDELASLRTSHARLLAAAKRAGDCIYCHHDSDDQELLNDLRTAIAAAEEIEP